MADPVVDALQTYYGFGTFRAGQREVIDTILSGRPTLAVMPTGAGKSLCYQLPALLLDGVTLVVSPLIALMKDQVDSLTARGIPAAFVNSTVDLAEQRRAMDAAVSGELKLLYVAPERFRYEGARASLRRLPLSLFAIDEAHCISQWGHDFRPDYKHLGSVAADLGAPRIAAFTATATRQVRDDIVATLNLHDPFVEVAGFLRPNLHFSAVTIRKMKQKPRFASQILKHAGGAGIVYCATRKHCVEAALELTRLGHEVVVYHGGLDDEERTRVQTAFQARDDLTIIATNAFGMGIDKPNVRAVVHWDIPGSIDAYYQEAGRAGRDGEPAMCVLLFTYADTRVQEFFIDNSGEGRPADVRAAIAEAERQKLRTIVRYAYDEGCRHDAILRYFGEWRERGGECPGCDNCSGGDLGLGGLKLTAGAPKSRTSASVEAAVNRPDPRPLTEAEEIIVQKVLSVVARSRGRLGVRALTRILRGSRAKDAVQDPLVASKSYGILAGMSEPAIMALFGALGRARCTSGRHPTLTTRGTEAMWRRLSLQLDVPPFGERSKRSRLHTVTVAGEPLTFEQRACFDKLKQARIAAARDRGVPAYTIATNKVLEQLARIPPESDRDAWLALKGVGETNVDPLIEVFKPLLGA